MPQRSPQQSTQPSTASARSSHRPVRRTHRLEAVHLDQTSQAGQTTAEYALLTGAIALLVAAVTAWATSTGKIGRLLDAVFNYLTKAIS